MFIANRSDQESSSDRSDMSEKQDMSLLAELGSRSGLSTINISAPTELFRFTSNSSYFHRQDFAFHLTLGYTSGARLPCAHLLLAQRRPPVLSLSGR